MTASRVFFAALSHNAIFRGAPLAILLSPLMIVPAWGREPDGGQQPPREPVSVFEKTTEVAARQESNPAVIRSRRLSGTLTGVHMAAAGDTWQLNLFDDAIVMAAIETVSVQGSGWALSGRTESPGNIRPTGVFTAVVNGGVLSAVVETGRGTYRVRSRDAMTHVIEEIAPALWPACGEPPAVPALGGDGNPAMVTQCCDDPTRLDVLVMYTPIAMNAAGGVEALTNEIELAVAVANAAYEASGVDTRLNLVHCALTDYTEDGSYSEHLPRFQAHYDGYMDEVHGLRDQYGADLVSLFVDDGEYCGQAYRMGTPSWGFAPYAFSVTTWYCAVGNKSFAHEIGHNQGCCHDHENTECIDWQGEPNPSYDHAYGHRFIGDSGSEWRTIMAIFSGQRIGRFSNPDVLYDGQPTGVADGPEAANNALTINNTSWYVAQFRYAIPECPWDCGEIDGVVGIVDILALLSQWGEVGGSCDLADNGVDTVDFLALLGNWGPCP
ncbi:MAG: M12 family metallo-peptidase [Planctomycetota bacterium]|jgi:hypothetical protein